MSEIDVHWTHEAGGARRRRQPKGSRQLGYHGRPLGPAEFSSPETIVAATYERYGSWLYRDRVLKDFLREIARDYHHTQAGHRRPFARCDDRPTIREGIKAAERVLRLDVRLFY